MDLFNYSRRESSEVNIGATPLGGNNPIRIQSMTNTVTMDTEACVEQAKRIIDAGGEYVRLTTQGVREAENLKNINIGLRSQGYDTPLVADVHFNPKVADVAAQYAEKVRINPGNYVDPGRTFRKLEYTDEEYTSRQGRRNFACPLPKYVLSTFAHPSAIVYSSRRIFFSSSNLSFSIKERERKK